MNSLRNQSSKPGSRKPQPSFVRSTISFASSPSRAFCTLRGVPSLCSCITSALVSFVSPLAMAFSRLMAVRLSCSQVSW